MRGYRTASELRPHRAMHHVGIGKLLRATGKHKAAAAVLEHALTLQPSDLNDLMEQRDAAALLARLRRTAK